MSAVSNFENKYYPVSYQNDFSRASFKSRCVHWVRADGKSCFTKTVRKICAIVSLLFLTFTVIGIYPVILMLKEWENQKKHNLALNIIGSPKLPIFPLTSKINGIVQEKFQPIHKCLGKVFVVMNESSHEHSRAILEKESKPANSCHIGCGGWHNFDIMSLRKSDYGVIFDYFPQNKYFIDITLKLIVQSENRFNFIERMNEYLKFNKIPLDTSHDRIRTEINREGSWLSSDKLYEHIKSLALQNKIATFTGDTLNEKVFRSLSSLLKESNYNIDTVYLSNIRAFIRESDKPKFINSISSIVQNDTLVVHCPKFPGEPTTQKEWCSLNLRQVIRKGQDLKNNALLYFAEL